MKSRRGAVCSCTIPTIVWFAGLSCFALQTARAGGKPSGPSKSQTILPIRLDRIPTLRVHLHGGSETIEPKSSSTARVAGTVPCGPTTYTDPNNFEAVTPVTLNIQQGFEEGEIAYASYVVDPTLFPIKLESFEMVFAQQTTTVPTVTHWSLLVWDGPPTPRVGIPVLTISSDDIEFPHLRMDPGLQAINLKIVVDPNDPQPIFLFNDSRTNMFTIGFRIDQHNSPTSTQTKCIFPPDPNANAFPTTDADGIASLENNWLNSIICNNACDGLQPFLTLPNICSPSGDWVIRATFSCTLIGACCDVDGVCSESVADSQCRAQGGTFMGENIACANVTCPEPVGACCFGGSALCNIAQPLCGGLSGVYMGNGTDCTVVDCSTGACCLPNGDCRDTVDIGCADLGGTFQGGTACANVSCPQPRGSCCINGQCLPGQFRNACESFGGTWNGIDSTCGPPDPCGTILCPTAVVFTANPPSGTVDARQPHDPGQTLPRQGIGSPDEPIVVSLGVDGADAGCFTLCETSPDSDLGVNAITSVTPLGGGRYEIALDHAITAGATTTLRYEGQPGGTITYLAHPGNTNGDLIADAADVAVLLDVLNQLALPTHGLYSSDIDHNGAVEPTDVLRLIDQLNGAGSFAVWANSPRPPDACP